MIVNGSGVDVAAVATGGSLYDYWSESASGPRSPGQVAPAGSVV